MRAAQVRKLAGELKALEAAMRAAYEAAANADAASEAEARAKAAASYVALENWWLDLGEAVDAFAFPAVQAAVQRAAGLAA